MKPTYQELRQLLIIDKHELDDVASKHSDAYHIVSLRLGDYTSFRDEAKEQLVKIKAEVDAEIRNKYRRRDERITEADVKAQIILSPRVEAAIAALHKYERKVALYTSLEKSFQQRSSMIKVMAQLYSSGYWGDHTGTASHLRQERVTRNKRLLQETREARTRE